MTRTRREAMAAMGGALAAAAAPAAPAAAQTEPVSAADILAAIRERRATATAIVAHALAQAEAAADLNAFIVIDKAGALEAARAVDAARDAGRPLGPLAGLPIVVKDNINTKDLPTTAGTPALEGARPKQNAPSLQKLLDAGAVVIGKTNMHELAFGITSTNLAPFARPVKNPYDPARIPGGSSGGTAAAIAAGIVPCGLGTDTGGSTRVPAALCGIVGLRPSVGDGGAQRRYKDPDAVVPISHTRDTVGPMGRSVGDVALLDAVIAGGPPASPAALQGRRVGLPASLWAGLDRETAVVLDIARKRLETAGVVFVDRDIPGLFAQNAKVSFPLALHEPRADIPAWLRASGVEGITLADIAAKIASPDVRAAFGAITADAFGAAYEDALTVQRPALQRLYADYFASAGVDAILFPTTVAPAPPIDAAKGSGAMSINGSAPLATFDTMIRNTDPGSNAGLPGLSIFAGMTPAGLPVGLEIDGPVGSDAALLSLGLAFETILGHAPPPPRRA